MARPAVSGFSLLNIETAVAEQYPAPILPNSDIDIIEI